MKKETILLIYRLVSIATFATIITITANTKNYIAILITFVVFIILSAIINTRLKKSAGIAPDERDWKIGGKAAFWAIRIYAIPTAIIGSIFVLCKDLDFIKQNNLYVIGQILTLSVCSLLLLYSVIFRVLREKGE